MNENTSNCLNCSQDQELWFVCNGEKIENAIPSSVIIVLWLIIMASVSCNLLVVLSISFKPALWSQTRYLFLSSRALQTVTLHAIHLALLLLALFRAPLMKWLQNLGLQKLALNGARIVIFLMLFVLPRFLSPLIYGMRDTKLRRRLKRHVFWAIST
uniref:odorant receptor 131-2-like n=1 Tax=Myxine glutinosa TaxID=7769 RepID=UPI00358DE246